MKFTASASFGSALHAALPRCRVRLSLAHVSLLAGLATAPAVQAVATPDAQWNNFVTVGTNWSVGANWLPAAAPAGSVDRVLGFSSSTLQSAGGYTSTHNLGAFDLNALVFSSGAASNPSMIVQGLAAADTLRFNTSSTGTLPSIWQEGSGRVIIQNGTSTNAMTLAGGGPGTTLQVLGDGIGELQLNGNIVQTGTASGLLINQTGTRGYRTGSMIRLGGTNSFTGGVNLMNGNLMIGSATALGAAASPLTVNGGTVQFDPTLITTTTIANPITLNSNLVLTGTNVVVQTTPPAAQNPVAIFTGAVTGAGGITIQNTNATSQYTFLNNGNTFSGPVTVNPIGVTVSFLNFGSDTVASGTASGATSFNISSNSSLVLNNFFGAQTRLNTVTPPSLTLNRANLNLRGNAAANVAETFGTLTVNGTGSLNALTTSTTLNTTSLTFGGLNRGAQGTGTLAVAGTNFGSGTGAGEGIVRFLSNPGGAIGGGGGAGTVTRSVLPYVISDSAPSTAGAGTAGGIVAVTNLVRWDSATGRLQPLDRATEYANNLFTTGTSAPTANHRYASTAALPHANSVAGVNGPTSVNGLVLDTFAPTSAIYRSGVSISGSGTLNVNGPVVTATSTNNLAITLPSMINTAGLNFGANPGYIHTNINGLVINANITGSAGVVKASFAGLALNGNNSFTGGLTINSGVVTFTGDANLGAAGQPVNLNGGITSQLQFLPSSLFSDTASGSVNVNRPINVGPAGTAISSSPSNGNFTLSGALSGSGQFLKTGNGVLTLSGNNSGYSGNIVANGGPLAVQDDAALGGPSAGLVIAGGTVQPLTSFTSNRDILSTATGFLFTGGQNITLTGNVTSQNATPIFLKTGLGDLTLTNTNTLLGSFQNGESTPVVRATAQSGAQTSGRTILSGPDGALPLASSVFSISGGEIVLDNTAAVNQNRIGSVTVGLLGGNVRLKGNAGQAVTEVIGALTINNANNQYGGTLTLEQPASAGLDLTTTLHAANFTNQAAPNVGTLFVRGNNLGGSSGDRTAVIFGANPAQSNGLIAAFVGATSATSDPTDFLTTSPIAVPAPNTNQFALVPFTAYTAGTGALAGGATLTYDVTGAATIAGGLAANALRIGAGGSLAMAGTTTITSGAILAAGGANSGITGGTLNYAAAVPARFTVATGSDLTVSSAITGTTGGFVKAGGGMLTLNNPVTTTTGLMSVAGGTLRYGASNILPATSNVFIGAGATLDLNSNASTLNGLIGWGDTNLGTGNLTLNVGTNPILTYGGGFMGSGNLIKTGALAGTTGGNQTLTGNSPGFSGGVRILAGQLTVNSTGALGTGTSPILLGDTSGALQSVLSLGPAISTFTRAITVQAGSSPATPHSLIAGAGVYNISSNILLDQHLRLTGTGGFTGTMATLSGTISGNGFLDFFNGNWALTGNNTFTGGANIDIGNNAAIGVGHNNAFGSGGLTFTTFGANLRADGGPRTIPNDIFLDPGAYIGVTGMHSLTFDGSIVDLSANTASQAFNIHSTAPAIFNGDINNGSGGITKNGPGTMNLARPGGNSYSGITTVNAGTLLVNNTTGSGTGSGLVVVNPGAIFGGSGHIITTGVTVDGVLSPGNSPGTLDIQGPLALGAGSATLMEIGGLSSYDQVTGLTDLTLDGLVIVTFFGTFGPSGLSSGDSFDLLNWSGTLNSGGFVLATDLIEPDISSAGLTWDNSTFLTDGIIRVIPEPSTALLAAAAALLGLRRRRK